MGNGQWGTANGERGSPSAVSSLLPPASSLRRTVRWLWLLVAIAGIGMMAWGVRTGQMADVKRHAEVLCTDCIGLGGH